MKRLTEEEKKELLDMAQSSQIKKDFREMKNNSRRLFLKKGKDMAGVDDFIKFLSFYDCFGNHPQKPFREIKGDKFIL